MCCKKNHTGPDAYDHSVGYTHHNNAQRPANNPPLHSPHAAARGRCCERRRHHGGPLVRLFGKIREHRAQAGVESWARPVIYQNEPERKGQSQMECGNSGSHDDDKRGAEHDESPREEAEPPSYEAVMKSG